MGKLDWFYAIMTLVALIGSFLVYRRDRKTKSKRKGDPQGLNLPNLNFYLKV